jgi:LPXTG-site transpeptidase (sortase) family protein
VTKQDPLAKQLETLFSDIVLPEPDVRTGRSSTRVAEAALAPPQQLRIPPPAATERLRRPERRIGLQWVMASLAAVAVVVLLGGLLTRIRILQAPEREAPAHLPVLATGAPWHIETSTAEPTVGDGKGISSSDITPSKAEIPSRAPERAVTAAFTRPMTLTISIAGQPSTSVPVPLPISEANNGAEPTVAASPTNAEPPPTADLGTSTPKEGARDAATPETTQAAQPTPTQFVPPTPTATQVVADPPTATILPSLTPTTVEQVPQTPTWTPTAPALAPEPASTAPDRLVIPAISLEAPIITVGYVNYTINGQTATTFAVPDHFAAGWHQTSAPPGFPGNTVLNGHQLINGGVFRDLEALRNDDEIVVYSGDTAHRYRVAEQHLLAEEGQPLSVRVENARWIMPTGDERLTLVTCAPYGKSSHRLIIVARPSSPHS